jgi:hypothetical protein
LAAPNGGYQRKNGCPGAISKPAVFVLQNSIQAFDCVAIAREIALVGNQTGLIIKLL